MDLTNMLAPKPAAPANLAPSVPVVVISAADATFKEFDAGKQWLVRRQFRSTDKTFGKREAVTSLIDLPLSLDVLVGIRAVVMQMTGIPEGIANTIVGEIGKSLQAVQNEIYKEAAVDSDKAEVLASINPDDFSLAAIAAFIVDREGSGSAGNAVKLTTEVINSFFENTIAGEIVSMLIARGEQDQDKIGKLVTAYQAMFSSLPGKKAITDKMLDSMAKIMEYVGNVKLAELDDADGAIFSAIVARIKKRKDALAVDASMIDMI